MIDWIPVLLAVAWAVAWLTLGFARPDVRERLGGWRVVLLLALLPPLVPLAYVWGARRKSTGLAAMDSQDALPASRLEEETDPEPPPRVIAVQEEIEETDDAIDEELVRRRRDDDLAARVADSIKRARGLDADD